MDVPYTGLRNVLIAFGGLIALMLLAQFHKHADQITPAPYEPIGVRYLEIDSPCAPSRSDAVTMLNAVRENDSQAVQVLTEDGKIFMLAAKTRFEVSNYGTPGFAWGFVRSGRQIGRDCYIPTAALR